MRNTTLFFTLLGACFCAPPAGSAKDAGAPQPTPITLASALRLAGANNLDIKIVEERLTEARADSLIALEEFLPKLRGGFGFRQHDGNAQTVEGRIVDVNKQLFTAGTGLSAEVELGNAVYNTLASRQLVKAASHATNAQKNSSIYLAAVAFFDLARAQGALDVAFEACRIAADYSTQVEKAAEAGLAYQGDVFQAQTQIQKYELLKEQLLVEKRTTSARLSQILNLDPALELECDGKNLLPLHIIDSRESLGSLVGKAMASRPELMRLNAELQASRANHSGAIYGPAIPSLAVETFWGGLGGGDGNAGAAHFGDSSDYFVGLSWKVGPGGLFDIGQIRKTESEVRQRDLEEKNYRNEVTEQVVAFYARTQSLSRQVQTAQKAVASSQKGLDLARERKQFAVGEVLENIHAQRDLTQTQLDLIHVLAEYNKSQFGLLRAIGVNPATKKQ